MDEAAELHIPAAPANNGHRHGKQGVLNTASNSQLENEFGTKNEDEIVKKILEKGDVQSSEVCGILSPRLSSTSSHEAVLTAFLQASERIGNTNDSKGAMSAH